MNKIKLIIFVLIAIFSVSCVTSDDCREETEALMQINFYTKTLNTTTSTYTNTALSIDSITVNGLGADSLLYNNSKSLKYIQVPLKKLTTQTDYIIKFNDLTDTISILYQNNDRYYLSMECGCIVVHSLDEIVSTNHFIDSISITNSIINTTYAENIQIYHF